MNFLNSSKGICDDKMSNENIDFDEEGNLIPQKVNFKIKHGENIKELIDELEKERFKENDKK